MYTCVHSLSLSLDKEDFSQLQKPLSKESKIILEPCRFTAMKVCLWRTCISPESWKWINTTDYNVQVSVCIAVRSCNGWVWFGGLRQRAVRMLSPCWHEKGYEYVSCGGMSSAAFWKACLVYLCCQCDKRMERCTTVQFEDLSITYDTM